jgi:23S rRNA (adenine2030-N6)-methyltransferase
MLSYRHAFHAGNHADVLKHFVLVQLLRHFNQKDKPYWLVDTHAGTGCYALDAAYAQKNREYENGISRLWLRQDIPPVLAEYVALVRSLNANGKLQRYPGSPWFAMHLMRAADRLRLFELHSSDVELLKKEFARSFAGQEQRYAIAESDGFAALKSVLPPPPRRGLVLIDPAYEDKRDYLRVIAAAKEGLARFAGGTYALWIPQLTRSEPRQLIEKLQKLPADWLHVRLTVQAPAETGFGMHGSSMFVVNPPWTLAATLGPLMPWLVAALGCDDSASFLLEQGSAAAPHAPPPRRAPVHGRP